MSTLSVVIIARDEAAMLPGCLRRLGFADEVLVAVDDRTVDGTAELARAAGAVVRTVPFADFATVRNLAMAEATGDWVLFLDADERVDPLLAAELRQRADGEPAAYRLPRRNVFQGHVMTAGDWTSEAPVRLIPRGRGRYEGLVHEDLVLDDDLPVRSTDVLLTHLSHRSIVENIVKTTRYAPAQAAGRIGRAGPVTPRVIVWSFVRELVRRLVKHRGYRDGVPGWAEALHQAYTLAVVDVLVWEDQQEPGLDEVYAAYDA